MANTFDCPKCGAPIDEADIGEDNDASVICKYCGKTVIVPPELRKQPPVVVQTIQSVEFVQPRQARRSPVLGCILFVVILTAVIGLVVSITATTMTNSLVSSVNQIISGVVTAEPTATDVFSAIETQVAPIKAQATKAMEELQTKIPRATPTPPKTATPKANLTATAAVVQITQAALTEKIIQQRSWPVVLDEKFSNASRNWTTGINNNNLALEEMSIENNRYTWKFTTKKPMASFSFPTMPEQSDQYISVDMQMTSDSGNGDDQAGITFRQSEADQTFYFFAVNPNGTYSLSMYDGSGWDTLIPTSDTDQLKSNQVNHLGVSIEGSQILLEINSIVVASYEDARLPAGVAGLGLHLPAPGEDATVIFTNFNVRAPKK
jgi:hypothetical protein